MASEPLIHLEHDDVASPCLDMVSERATVLVVDDVEGNRRLLRAMLKTTDHHVLEATRASDALALLETEKVDLIIVELVMPEVSGPQFCRMVKADRRTRLIPILMLTSVPGVASEVEAISSGADELLFKPLHPAIVRARVSAMLQHKALVDSLEEAESILFALAQSVEHRDPHTGRHCERLAGYSVALGRALGLDRPSLVALQRGGYLHDIGKIAVPDRILFKNGRLSDEEWSIMRQHTVCGAAICARMKTLSPVVPIIRSHHERWDGSGYPDGLAGEDIPLLARILQVADIYDALTTERPYKPAYSHVEAILTLNSEVKRGWRDRDLVALFADTIVSPSADAAGELAMGESLSNLDTALRGDS